MHMIGRGCDNLIGCKSEFELGYSPLPPSIRLELTPSLLLALLLDFRCTTTLAAQFSIARTTVITQRSIHHRPRHPSHGKAQSH